MASAAFLYLQLFIFPNLPMMPSGDQLIWIFDGIRLLHGEVMYRDFFHYTGPGSATAWCALFYLFGVRAWVVNATLLCLGVGFAWTSVVISRKLFNGVSTLLPGFLFLVIPFRNAPIDTGSHHWYSSLAAMIALAVLMDRRTQRRLVAAGALCGLCAWFNQPRGLAVVLGLGVFLLWERKQGNEPWRSLAWREAGLFSSFLVTLAGLSSYFIWKAGPKIFVFCTFVFLMKYFHAEPNGTWTVYGADMGSLENWYSSTQLGKWLVVELLVPWMYFLFFLRMRHARNPQPQEPWHRLMLVGVVGLFMFLSVAPSALNYRLCTVSLPAFILLVWFAKCSGKTGRVTLRFMWIGLLALMIAETHSNQTRWHTTMDLPIGHVATYVSDEPEVYQWFLSHRGPSDYLFAFPGMNFALGIPNPTPIDFLTTSDFTRPGQVVSVIDGLEARSARWVVWPSGLNNSQGPSDHLGSLRVYLGAHYHVAKTFGSEQQFLERNGQ
jgi:hypothetical protein